MGCPDEVTLSAYCDGELEDAEARAVEAHIAGCLACQERLGDMRAADDAASEMFRAMAPPEREPGAMVEGAHARRWGRLGLAAAAVLLAAGTGVWMAVRGPAGPAGPDPVGPARVAARDNAGESLADMGVLPLQLAAVEGETRSFEPFGPVEPEADAQAQEAEALSRSWLVGAAPLERRVRRAADELSTWQAERRLEKCLFLIDVSRSVI